jgi:hypothetical protein
MTLTASIASILLSGNVLSLVELDTRVVVPSSVVYSEQRKVSLYSQKPENACSSRSGVGRHRNSNVNGVHFQTEHALPYRYPPPNLPLSEPIVQHAILAQYNSIQDKQINANSKPSGSKPHLLHHRACCKNAPTCTRVIRVIVPSHAVESITYPRHHLPTA